MRRKKEIKFFTKSKLLEANRSSMLSGSTRYLQQRLVNQLEEGKLFPVLMRVITAGEETRLCVIINDQGATGVIDVTCDMYKQLPALHV